MNEKKEEFFGRFFSAFGSLSFQYHIHKKNEHTTKPTEFELVSHFACNKCLHRVCVCLFDFSYRDVECECVSFLFQFLFSTLIEKTFVACLDVRFPIFTTINRYTHPNQKYRVKIKTSSMATLVLRINFADSNEKVMFGVCRASVRSARWSLFVL